MAFSTERPRPRPKWRTVTAGACHADTPFGQSGRFRARTFHPTRVVGCRRPVDLRGFLLLSRPCPLPLLVIFGMSLFMASRLLRAPLRQTACVLGTARMAPCAIHTSAKVQGLPWAKNVPTTSMTEEQDLQHLNARRNDRPISPHVEIYQPQLTWCSSIAHRVTGVGLSGALYASAVAYVAAPYMGLGELVSSASLVDVVSHMPVWAKLLVKAPLAAAFSYHSLNGIRHLLWDWALCTTLRSSYAAGYAVIGLTGVATVGLCML